MGFGGLDEKGAPLQDWGWDPSCLEEGGEKRKDLGDTTPAFGCGQNGLLFDAKKRNKRGEAALGFVGHDTCRWEIVKGAMDLSYGGVLLRLMAQYFLDRGGLDDVYN